MGRRGGGEAGRREEGEILKVSFVWAPRLPVNPPVLLPAGLQCTITDTGVVKSLCPLAVRLAARNQ